MRATTICLAALFAMAAPCLAQDAKQDQPVKPAVVLTPPASTQECLEALATVLQRAVEANLLDDQIDAAETHLEKLEAACVDGRFAEALDEAKAIEKLLATNK
jgi:hypothetical protein